MSSSAFRANPSYPEAVAIQWFSCSIFMDKTNSPEGKGFRLKQHEKQPDAPLSPFYLNFRLLRSFPYALANSTSLLKYMWEDVGKCDLLADIPTAITPVVAVLSQKTGIPMVTPREPKAHGSGAKIDGVFTPGQTVALFDDLITKADSKFEAISVLQAAGLVVKDVFVFVDREQGGAQQLAEKGYNLHAAWTIHDLLSFYLKRGLVGKAVYDEIVAYLG